MTDVATTRRSSQTFSHRLQLVIVLQPEHRLGGPCATVRGKHDHPCSFDTRLQHFEPCAERERK